MSWNTKKHGNHNNKKLSAQSYYLLVKEKCTKWNDGERCLYLPLKNIPIEIIISRKHGTPEKANAKTSKLPGTVFVRI